MEKERTVREGMAWSPGSGYFFFFSQGNNPFLGICEWPTASRSLRLGETADWAWREDGRQVRSTFRGGSWRAGKDLALFVV